MSKKSKKRARKISAADRASVVSRSSTTEKPVERGFNPDYTYVIKDLRRIGTLAVSFFVLLVVLSFFLR